MATAYQTGTASTPGAVVTALKNFLQSNGWTVDEYDTSDTQNYYDDGGSLSLGADQALFHAHKGSLYVHARSTEGAKIYSVYSTSSTYGTIGIGLYASDAYNSGNNWDKQGNYLEASDGDSYGGFLHWTGTCTYFFFSWDDSMAVIVKDSNGDFMHGYCGLVDIFGSASDGIFWGCTTSGYYGKYVSNSYGEFACQGYNMALFHDSIHYYNDRGYNFDLAASDPGYGDDVLFGPWTKDNSYSYIGITPLLRCSPNDFNAVVVGFPVYLFTRNAAQDRAVPLGFPPNVRIAGAAGVEDESEQTFGTETWKMFSTYLDPEPEVSSKVGILYKKA